MSADGRTAQVANAGVAGIEVAGRIGPLVVLAFATAYFLSSLVRAITATLAPVLTEQFALSPADLGLLAGAYFFGFALPQLLLGHWLDKAGPKRVLLGFLGMAVLGCAAFAFAASLPALVLARAAIGVGVCACLMAPMTAFRRWFDPATQLRLNAWMLMSGSFGIVASTLPVQWLLPLVGWRGIFIGLAGCFVAAMGLLAWLVPRAGPPTEAGVAGAQEALPPPDGGYREVWRHPVFIALAPVGFVVCGGLVALQTLWVAPWLTRVQGLSPNEGAWGLFVINLAMLVTFGLWGACTPWLARRGIDTPRLLAWGVPMALAWMAVCIALGPRAGAWHWAAALVLCSVAIFAQPYLGQTIDVRLAGRALSAFNLAIFLGVFCVQWSIGGLIAALQARGWGVVAAHQAAFSAYVVAALLAYAWHLIAMPRRPRPTAGAKRGSLPR